MAGHSYIFSRHGENQLIHPYFFFFLFLLFGLWSHLAGAEDKDKISVLAAHELLQKNAIVMIDIRSVGEWEKTGVATQAIPLTMHRDGGIPAFSHALAKLLEGDKTRPVALICAKGVRSSRVQQYLQKHGFTHVLDVQEGMVGGFFTEGWIDQGLPIKPYINQ